MASTILLPSSPNTGLTSLANVLLSGATDYANRTDRLSDIGEQRVYDEKEKALALTREMVRLGLLLPADITDLAKVEAAFQKFGRSADAKLYKEALDSGALSYDDLGDPGRVAAGLSRYSAELEQTGYFKRGLPAQAKARSDQLTAERDQIIKQQSALEQRLSEPEPQPNPQAVRALASQIARSSLPPGSVVSAQAIAEAEPAARDQIAKQIVMAWSQQRQDAALQIQILASRLRDVSAEQNTITNRFGVVGVAPERSSPPPSDEPTTPASNVATVQKSFAEEAAALAAEKRAAAAAEAARVATPAGNFTYQGGLLGGVERLGAAAGRLTDVPGALTRRGEAIGRGLLTGDYSVPERSRIERFGESIGTSLFDIVSEGEQRVEDTILREQPNSERANSIRARRAQLQQPVPPRSVGGSW